jgi:hypothetical protein
MRQQPETSGWTRLKSHCQTNEPVTIKFDLPGRFHQNTATSLNNEKNPLQNANSLTSFPLFR